MVCSEHDRNKSLKFKNWDGRAVKRVRARHMNKFSITQFLMELPQEKKDLIFSLNYPNVYFCDIETEVLDGFPDPNVAKSKILSISIATPNKQIVVLGLKDLSHKEQMDIQQRITTHIEKLEVNFNFIYKKFETERDMLVTFLEYFVKKFPMVSGWNFIDFDWTYIVNRCRRIGVDVSKASPVGKDDDSHSHLPLHVGMFDYLDVYRKWDRTIAVKENYKLDYTADRVLGIKKINYKGSLQELYEKDFLKFIFYNAVDSILVHMIHETIKTLDIVFTLSNLCFISIYKAASPVTITESLMCRKFLEEDKVMATDINSFQAGRKKVKYTGAYVKAPIVGMHQGVACFDFASLYPSIMRQFNVSPESLRHVIPGAKKIVSAADTPDKRYNLDLIEEEKAPDKIVSITGVVYDKKDSVIKKITNDLYSKRKQYKAKGWEYQMEAEKIKKLIQEKKNV